MAVHGNPRPIPVPALKPVPLAALEPVPIPAPLPVEPTLKPKYQFIPSTYENRGNWFDEPCALRKNNCKGGDKCNHCGGTPRREWYETLREEREVSMYD